MDDQDENSMDVDKEIDTDISSDAEDNDSAEDEKNQEDLNKRKKELIDKIENDCTDYYAYIELIDILTTFGDLDELRNIRTKFNKEYPLSPDLWLAWIEDEKKIASTVAEKQAIIDLFENALKDYQSVDVWCEYGQFSIGLMKDGSAFESVRGIMERAVEKCGCNVSKGSLLWDLYRLFEGMVLQSLQCNEKSEENDARIKGQKYKIINLFRRQLSTPLLDMETTYEEMKQWLLENDAYALVDVSDVESSFKSVTEKLSRLLLFENELSCCNSVDSTLPIYQRYLDFEKNPIEGGNEQARVICLYERGIADHPLIADLWLDYIKYISELNIVPEDREAVCYRALRNCPVVAKFWTMYMIHLERRNVPKSQITEFFNKALQNRFPLASDYRSLWLYYLYYWRRLLNSMKRDTDPWNDCVDHIRQILEMATSYMNEKRFEYKGDPNFEISSWWARFEADTTQDLPKFRQLWSDMMESGLKKSVSSWLKYISMEWQYGDGKHLRRLFIRALNSISGNPKAIINLWVEYETTNGSLDSFLKCEKVCQEKLEHYANEEKEIREQVDKKKKDFVKNNLKKNLGKESLGDTSKTKHPASDSQKKTEQKGLWSSLTEKSSIKVFANPVSTNRFDRDPSKNVRTVFISNLDYTVTEDEVKNILSSVGKVEEFDLVRGPEGRSRGYGYLIFSSKKEAEEALKLDRIPVKERPMFISECNTDKLSRKTGLRFSTGVEKNKLFVKGLPFTLDKTGVENIFSSYGILKDVRVVTYRNGCSKGLAYVEFEDEVSAAHALLKTDKLEVEGKVISVAISNPPEKKKSDGGFNGGTRSTEGDNFPSRPHRRTQLSFIPSILSSKKLAVFKSEVMDVSDSSTVTSREPMSNKDFRNLLTSKK